VANDAFASIAAWRLGSASENSAHLQPIASHASAGTRALVSVRRSSSL
jgi:hypothetical protein